MINYIYDRGNNAKDVAVDTFLNSIYANYPELNHTVPLNRCVEDLLSTRNRKRANYSYFYCDKNTEHLLIIPNEPVLHIIVSDCGKMANLFINNEIQVRNLPLVLVNNRDNVYAFKGPITMNGTSYDLTTAFTILLKDPEAPVSGNRSITGYNLRL